MPPKPRKNARRECPGLVRCRPGNAGAIPTLTPHGIACPLELRRGGARPHQPAPRFSSPGKRRHIEYAAHIRMRFQSCTGSLGGWARLLGIVRIEACVRGSQRSGDSKGRNHSGGRHRRRASGCGCGRRGEWCCLQRFGRGRQRRRSLHIRLLRGSPDWKGVDVWRCWRSSGCRISIRSRGAAGGDSWMRCCPRAA